MAGIRSRLALGLGAGVAGAAAAVLGGGGAVACVAAFALGASLGAARHHPRAAWAVAVAALLAGANDDAILLVPFLLVIPHAFAAGRWETRGAGIVAVVALIASAELSVALTDDSPVPYLLLIAAPWAAGRALGERDVVAARLAERARELDEEREAHAALSVRYERARIASELHDIVAHAISVMVVQAGAGQRLAAHDPEATAETFQAISGAARQAEQDMGRLVELLGDEHAIGPAPDLALVEELVARAAGSGLDVTLRLEGSREGLPAAVVQAAYRVVQEGLTNALRYASGAAVSVLVRGGHDEVVVEVANGPVTGPGALEDAGTGNGLRGLRERVGACGGTLDAGPAGDGGWCVRASLPRRVGAAAG